MRDDKNFSGATMRWHVLWKVLITACMVIAFQISSNAQIGMSKNIPLPGVRAGGSADRIIVTYHLRVQNTGSAPLHQIQITEDLAGNLGSSFNGLVGTPMILSQPAGQAFDVSGSFNGDTDTDLLVSSTDDTLKAGELLHISLEVEINLSILTPGEVLLNNANVSAVSADVAATSFLDISDSGTDPAGTNDDDPLRGALDLPAGGGADPTPLPFCADCALFCPISVSASFDPNCQADVRQIYRTLLSGADSSICVDLGFYTFDVRTSYGASVGPILLPTFFEDPSCFTVMIRSICRPGEVCQSSLCLKQLNTPIIRGGDTTVYCNDPLVTDPSLSPVPTAMIPCQGAMQAEFTADWIEVKECDFGIQDTAKIIYRQYAATSKDGTRGVGYDTVYVLRLPPLSADNLFCAEKDTIYCNGDKDRFGPFILLPPADPLALDCDTIYLLNEDLSAPDISPKCGFSIKVDTLPFSGTTCNRLTRVEVQIYQDCYGAEDAAGPCTVPSSDVVINGGMGQPIFAVCNFWLIELDTAPPLVHCLLDGYAEVDTIGGIPTAYVDAGPMCTSSNMILPPVIAVDSCGDVIQVKAIVDTLGAFTYDYDSIAGVYRNNLHIPLPFRDEPYVIIIEALDACTNVGRDTCAVIVRDLTSPTVVNHPGLNIDLSGKEGFLKASQIDNGTFDNCELGFVLARRTDWLTAWPDFCDSLRLEVTSGDDSIWCHKIINPGTGISDREVFYRSMMDSILMSTLACSDLLLDAWQYDLCRYATVICKGSLSQAAFDSAYADAFSIDNIPELAQIGGGWGVQVPFSCVDACDSVPVELLAVDSWCNYSTGWAKVLVKDDNPPTVAQALEDYLEVSCATFNLDTTYLFGGSKVTLSTIVQAAEMGDADALAVLDTTFGTYVKAWSSPAGVLVDIDGIPIPEEVTFVDHGLCRSDQVTRSVRYYDRNAMMMVNEDSLVDRYFRKDTTLIFDQGILEAECANTQCTQTVTTDLDDCGLGVITRTFTIWKSCPGIDTSDAVILTQEILLKNTCELKKEQFSLPQDTILYTCLPEREVGDLSHINGEAHPDSIGAPVYLFEDGCRNIGIARVDESVTNSMDDACFFIYRTWYFADWCASDSTADWWMDNSLVSDSFTQVIVFRDSIDPVCTILMPDTIRLSTCGQVINPVVAFSDDCTLRQFHFSFDTIGGATPEMGSPFLMPTEEDTATLAFFMITNGVYTLDILVTDHCGNESICKDTVVVACDVSRQAASQMDMDAHEQDVNPDKGMDNERSISRLGKPAVDPSTHQTVGGDGYDLFQNRPNPFEHRSVVGFNLPQREEVTIAIYDVQGRLLHQYQGSHGKGYHELEVDRNELDASGILYYRMTTKAFTATRKMIISP